MSVPEVEYEELKGFGLPISDKWFFRPIVRDNLRVPVGATLTVVDEPGYGWLLSGYLVCDSPDLRLLIQCQAGLEVVELTQTPRERFNWGQIGLVGGILWSVVRYDLINNVYVLNFTGNFPGTPWGGILKIFLENEGAYEATATRLFIHRIIVVHPTYPLQPLAAPEDPRDPPIEW